MRSAYVLVDLGGRPQCANFLISPVPFVWHYGEILIPSKSELKEAASYAELCSILVRDFAITPDLLPAQKYFKATAEEKLEDPQYVYRTVPEGTGEPEWRAEAQQAVISLLEDENTHFEKGYIAINDCICHSEEHLRDELEKVAELAGGERKAGFEAYQRDYSGLVTDILKRYSAMLGLSGLPKRRKNR